MQCFVCIDQNFDDCSDVGNFVSFVNDDIGRLTEDIENAQYVHQQLSGKLHKVRLQEEVQTNILMLNLTDAGILADEFCKRAKERGLLIRPIRNQYRVRLVFYKGITRKDAEEAAAILLALDSEL